MYECDELRVYRGKPVRINQNFSVFIPTLDQIEEFGEKRYFNAVHNFTSVGADLKWQLWDLGVDYTQIEDYDLFTKLIFQLVSSKKRLHDEVLANPDKFDRQFDSEELDELLINPLQLVMKETVTYEKLFKEIGQNYEEQGILVDAYGTEYSDDFVNGLMDNPSAIFYRDIDFANYQPYIKQDNKQVVLYNNMVDVAFDRLAYAKTVSIIRNIHGFKRNNQKPANERTKMDLIEDAKDEAMMAMNKPYKSVLKSLISTLQVHSGQCGDDKIWNMPISAFFDNVKRIGKIQDAQLLLQGAYSGFANLKGVDKNRLDMFGDIGTV